MKNKYEICGKIIAVIIDSPKYGRRKTYISKSKFERVNEFSGSWYVWWNNHTKSFYVRGHSPERGSIYLHRWLMSEPEGMVVDHRDRDTLNNTDSNLRVVTQNQNRQNLKGIRSNNTSGVRGVSWSERHKKWRVQIQVNKITNHIGLFKNIEDAELASIEARKTHMPYSN